MGTMSSSQTVPYRLISFRLLCGNAKKTKELRLLWLVSEERMDDALRDISVSEIMRRWPGTIRVFLDLHLYCVGCPIGVFHTLADAADEHGIERSLLETRIGEAIRAAGAREVL
jgi:hybrid cluster-associated redox disulfide protein